MIQSEAQFIQMIQIKGNEIHLNISDTKATLNSRRNINYDVIDKLVLHFQK